MAYESKADLRAERDNLLNVCRDQSSRIQDLEAQVVVSDLTRLLTEELDKPENTVYLTEQAMVLARLAVFEAERERITAEIAEKLKVDRYDEFAVLFQTNEATAIKDRLHSLFIDDGTYDGIEERVRVNEKQKIRRGLLEDARQEALRRLTDPVERQPLIDEAAADIRDSEAVVDITREVRQGLEAEWGAVVLEQVEQQITEEERGREDEFKASKRKELEDGRHMRDHRAKIRANLEREWSDKTLEEVYKAIEDEEMRSVIDARIQQEKEELQVGMLASKKAELGAKFKGLGLATNEIEAGAVLTVYLGTVQKLEIEKTVKDQWDRPEKKKVMVDSVVCARRLTFVSHGDGKFTLQTDSLHESESIYERQVAIKSGTVVSLGQQRVVNGQPEFDNSISAGRELYIDFNDTDTHTDSAHLAVCELKIDDLRLRDELEVIKLMYKKSS